MRLAIVAASVLLTTVVLTVTTIEARRADRALDEAAAHTLRDYAGYAGRTMGGEVLRRFAEQRAAILAPVTGSANRAVPEPTLEEIARRAEHHFQAFPPTEDMGLGYFRVDLRSGSIAGRGSMPTSFAARVADTLTRLLANTPSIADPSVLVMDDDGVPRSVAYASLIGPSGQPTAAYGFAYDRAIGISSVAARAFRETPLLPISFAGKRWNYDTTLSRVGEVANDSLLSIRITDRAGHVFWRSEGLSRTAGSSYEESAVLSTAPGGIIVEAALRPSSAALLIPSVVRHSQQSLFRAMLALAALLSLVSLLALRRERLGARFRRAEAMQQLALGLRHEINNALASVMLDAELLAEEDDMGHEQRARLTAIIEQADRMRNVLRRLENAEQFDVVVPYLNKGYMVDLSAGGGEGQSNRQPA